MITRHPARTSWSRRDMLRGSAAALMGAYGLAPRYGFAADIPMEYDGSKFHIAAPEPNPKRGGVMRYGILNRPPHFDVHQSGTVGNIGTQGCMFDNLIRRDPRDSGKTIIPDLAHSWEIAKDGKTYTFHLRKGVQFHDGAELTSEDVKATFDRIAKPPQGISIPRSVLFGVVSEINARDKYTVEFKLSEPRPVNFMMSAIGSGWNVIVRKKTLEDNHYDLRKVQVYPGTGPFRSVKYTENEVWINGEEQKLLEQGVAVFGRDRVLPRFAIFSGNGVRDTGEPRGLCVCDRSGHVPEGGGDAGIKGVAAPLQDRHADGRADPVRAGDNAEGTIEFGARGEGTSVDVGAGHCLKLRLSDWLAA